MKKMVPILIVVMLSAILLAGCDTGNKTGYQGIYDIYSSPDGKYGVHIPSPTENPGAFARTETTSIYGSQLCINPPGLTGCAILINEIELNKVDNNSWMKDFSKPYSLDSIKEDYQAFLIKTNPGIVFSNESTTSLAGATAYKFENERQFKNQFSETLISKGITIITIKNNVAYILTYSNSKDNYAKNLPDFEYIVSSFTAI